MKTLQPWRRGTGAAAFLEVTRASKVSGDATLPSVAAVFASRRGGKRRSDHHGCAPGSLIGLSSRI